MTTQPPLPGPTTTEGEGAPGKGLARAEELLANLYELHDYFFTADKDDKKVCLASSDRSFLRNKYRGSHVGWDLL